MRIQEDGDSKILPGLNSITGVKPVETEGCSVT